MISQDDMQTREDSRPPHASAAIAFTFPPTFTLPLILAAGLMLRLWCARGDLWLDEIWSYRLAAQAQSMLDVMFALPYDNNHVLNTLWLKLVGTHVPSPVTRLPAILYGTLSILAAWGIGRRDSKSGGVIFALIFAFDFAFLDFESEARGYAGLILAFLAGFYGVENILSEKNTDANLTLFGLSICFGALSHLTMIEPAGIFWLYFALSIWQRDGLNPVAIRKIAHVSGAALLGLAPVVLGLAVTLAPGILHVGRITPFSLEGFMDGLSLMGGAALGFPDDARRTVAAPVFLLVIAGLVTGLLCYIPRRRRLFYILTILVLPAIHIALHIRNLQLARFHLTTALALAVLGAEATSVAWARSRLSRNIALAAILGFLICQTAAIAQFSVALRGNYKSAAVLMSQDGPSTFIVIPELVQGETAAVVRWYSPIPQLLTTSQTPDCSRPPDWTLENIPANQAYSISQIITVKTGTCGWTYRFAQAFPSFGLSGYTWLLYSIRK